MHYRSINSEFYCGVDIHPKHSQVCVLDNSGKKHINKNMVNNFNNFKQIIQPFLPNIVVGCDPPIVTIGWLMAAILTVSRFIWGMHST